jgi:hypothetical protein
VRERFEAHKRSFKRSVSVNFLSASKPPLSPPHVNADRVQEYVLRKYIERDTNRKLGIVVMDFPGTSGQEADIHKYVYMCVCVRVCVCVRACVRACARARACVTK